MTQTECLQYCGSLSKNHGSPALHLNGHTVCWCVCEGSGSRAVILLILFMLLKHHGIPSSRSRCPWAELKNCSWTSEDGVQGGKDEDSRLQINVIMVVLDFNLRPLLILSHYPIPGPDLKGVRFTSRMDGAYQMWTRARVEGGLLTLKKC